MFGPAGSSSVTGMLPVTALIGRERETAELESLIAAARDGHGAVVLVAGEAGFGKSRLVDEAAAASALTVLTGASRQGALSPYAAVVAALRTLLRADPGALRDLGPLTGFLTPLLPELGRSSVGGDSATLLEAFRETFHALARAGPIVLVLDDLHWSDDATLSLLPALADGIDELGLLVLGVYRSDELPRGHPLRRVRRELRRVGPLRELVLEPLAAPDTGAVAAAVLGSPLTPALAALVHERTHGIPFFVEELCAALVASNRLVLDNGRVALEGGSDLPVPESVRDAVLVRVSELSGAARTTLDVAAVCGYEVELELVVELAGENGIDEVLAAGMLREAAPGRAVFRHALTREALYADVPWTRRRTLHRLLGERLELRRAPPLAVGEHWLAAREFHRACPALAAAMSEFCAIHAYRDALAVGRRAMDVWPDGLDELGRLLLIEEIGRCAQIAGALPEAVSAWREVADRRSLAGDAAGTAEAERSLAMTYELQGSVELAQTTRRAAARNFARAGRHADAAGELLSTAAHLDSAGSLGAALEVVEKALEEARASERPDLEARALGIAGTVQAKLGRVDAGLELARAGLTLALDNDASTAAVSVYQHVANVLENAGNYRAAWDTYQEAYEYCDTRGADAAAQVCLVCLAFILVHTGDWTKALELDRSILASPHSPTGVRMAAKQHFGLIAAARGDSRTARRNLNESGAYAERHERQRMEVWDAMGQGWVDELEGAVDAAVERCRFILARWGASESIHYPVPALRWATTFLATHGCDADARACAAALARLAGATVNPEALAALAHALGEISLLDDDAEQASTHFEHALGVLGRLELPYETAQAKLRAGVALVRAGRREPGIERMTDAYRIARKLGARPFAARVAGELAALGEQVERRLGRRAAAQLEGPGLTRRELEIMRLVSTGRTNRDIAGDLFLSPRTVDMHVRNILRKLDARSRAEATRNAGALGLLG